LCEFIKTFSAFIRLGTIKNITLVQYRNYSAGKFANGSGKTNLLDAIYYLCYTKSYFTPYQQNTVQQGFDGFRVEGVFIKLDEAETIACKWKQGKKEVSADGVVYDRVTDHIGKYAAVMVAPDDMELINDGSELRRRWVDGILSQTSHEYLERLMRYQRVLLQRNAWLKLHTLNPPSNSNELDFYNRELAADGTFLFECRKQFTTEFKPLLIKYYALISGSKEEIAIDYESDLFEKSFDTWLTNSFQHDLRMQRTLKGIHKDDWTLTFDKRLVKTFGSQGQKKSCLFAMKLAQYAYLRLKLGHNPILLLDDIFEKLDQDRMEALLEIIRGSEFGQVVLTDTHAERVKAAFGIDTEIHFVSL
jgi:DNA replication and repair protein RecF